MIFPPAVPLCSVHACKVKDVDARWNLRTNRIHAGWYDGTGPIPVYLISCYAVNFSVHALIGMTMWLIWELWPHPQISPVQFFVIHPNCSCNFLNSFVTKLPWTIHATQQYIPYVVKLHTQTKYNSDQNSDQFRPIIYMCDAPISTRTCRWMLDV